MTGSPIYANPTARRPTHLDDRMGSVIAPLPAWPWVGRSTLLCWGPAEQVRAVRPAELGRPAKRLVRVDLVCRAGSRAGAGRAAFAVGSSLLRLLGSLPALIVQWVSDKSVISASVRSQTAGRWRRRQRPVFGGLAFRERLWSPLCGNAHCSRVGQWAPAGSIGAGLYC